MNATAQISALDDEIAKLQSETGPETSLEVAQLRLDQADLAGGTSQAALEYLNQAMRSVSDLARAGNDDALALLIYAQNSVVIIHSREGRPQEAYPLAHALVDEHFNNSPDDSAEAMVNAAFWVAVEDRIQGDPRKSLELVDRVLERYGSATKPGWQRTTCIAHLIAGRALQDQGRPAEASERFQRSIDVVVDTKDPELRAFLVEAMQRKGLIEYELGRRDAAEALYRSILEGFDRSEGRVVADAIDVAEEWLGVRQPRRRPPLRRRGGH